MNVPGLLRYYMFYEAVAIQTQFDCNLLLLEITYS